MSAARSARVRAFAKINLDLRVLGKRPDGYHELRTVFQTISLADTLDIAFTPARRTSVGVAGNVEIADNIVVRAARLALEAMRRSGAVEIGLKKVVPMGAGLGGGSSDAAAVLLALPVLAGRPLPLATLAGIAGELGSDVTFFLHGGRAAGIGRGTELFPLSDLPSASGVLAAPAIHVSTAAAYRSLGPHLTSESEQNKMVSFQTLVWGGLQGSRAANDFETAVFEQYPSLASLKRRLKRMGADPALMTGSGSAVFGFFRTRDEAARAIKFLKDERVFLITLVGRSRYRSLWRRWLRAHSNDDRIWPPQSRYVR